MSQQTPEVRRAIGIGYTLATGRLFCDFHEFHSYAEKLIAQPIMTHEFGDQATWDKLRARYESLVRELSTISPSAGDTTNT